jgi:hypothetical protein
MDNKTFEERTARLNEVAKIIEKIPDEIRHDAFQLLKDYVTGQKSTPSGKTNSGNTDIEPVNIESKRDFFAQYDNGKPADNVKLLAAWFYNEYGTEAFSIDELREEADNVGITIPSRPDATIKTAAAKGKKLFNSAGRGKYKPTVHGETNLKELYSVKKGTKTRTLSE